MRCGGIAEIYKRAIEKIGFTESILLDVYSNCWEWYVKQPQN